MILQHPITHINQYYIVPSDCENGDNIGKVNQLWTHKEFFKNRWGIELLGSGYSFSIVGGNSDNAFSIDSETGELTVNNSSNVTTRNITVKVSVFAEWYFQYTTCHIEVIPSSDCIYFDPDFVGTSNGTRSAPYTLFRTASLGNGTAGKTYLWRRGKTFEREVTKIVNGPASDKIRFGAWGQGIKPIIDNTGVQSNSERFLDIGLSSQTVGSDTGVCYNFEIYDIDFVGNKNDANGSTVFESYFIRAGQRGTNWKFNRLKATGTNFSNGNYWFVGTTDHGYINKEIELRDIECYETTQSRGIKFESGGIQGWNFKVHTAESGAGWPISAATQPNVKLKYIWAHLENSNSNSSGLQVRARENQYEWCYLKNPGYAMTAYVLSETDGLDDYYEMNDGSVWFKNIIVDGGQNYINRFQRPSTPVFDIDGIIFENIWTKNTAFGLQVLGGAKNTLFKNCVITGDGSVTGLRIWSSGGIGTKIHHSIVTGFSTNFINADQNCEAINCIGEGAITGSGTVTQSNNLSSGDFIDSVNFNFRPTENANQLGAGTDLGYVFDIDGNLYLTPPSIGAYEYNPQTEPEEPDYFLIHKKVDFEETPLGTYTSSRKADDWGSINFTNHNTEVIEDFQGSRRMKCLYPEDSTGANNGSDFGVNLSDIGDEVYLTYEMYFPSDFDFAHPTEPYQNGKLCGFRMMTAMIACNSSTPALRGDRGAIMYPIWGSSGNFAWNVYHHEQTTNCGDRMDAGSFSSIIKGEWNKITFRVVLNTPGTANGVLQLWIRDELVSTVTGIMFRTETSVQEINHLAIFTSTDWDIEIHKDMHLYMDNFYLWRYTDEAIASDSTIKSGTGELWGSSDEFIDPLSVSEPGPDPETYTVSLSASPTGGGTVNEITTGPYEENDNVQVEYSINEGYRFIGWEEDNQQVSTDNPYSFSMPSNNRTLVAVFEVIPTYTVSLSVDPIGFGTVEKDPEGEITEGENVTITATPDDGKRFVRWHVGGTTFSTANPHNFEVNENYSITAEFEDIPPETYSLTVQSNNSNWGTAQDVTDNSPYEQGEQVSVSATPGQDYYFVNWTVGGQQVSTEASFVYTMPEGDTTIIAVFAEKKSLALVSMPSGAGTLTGAGLYTPGESVPIEATPNTGWTFAYWMRDAQVISTYSEFVYTKQSSNESLTAFFESTGATGGENPTDYYINGELLSSFGIIPGHAPGSNIALSGVWDMPARIGKVYHQWGDHDGVEPYLREDEIFFEGIDVKFYGYIKSSDRDEVTGILSEFYEYINQNSGKFNFSSPFGVWEVELIDGISARYLNNGYFALTINMRLAVVPMDYPIPEPSENYIGIDGINFKQLGLWLMDSRANMELQSARENQITVYGQEKHGKLKRNLKEYSLRFLIDQPGYAAFADKINTLRAMFASPGLRTLKLPDGTYRELFINNGFSVSSVKNKLTRTTGILTVNVSEYRLLKDWNLLTDSEGNVLVDGEGRLIIEIIKGE